MKLATTFGAGGGGSPRVPPGTPPTTPPGTPPGTPPSTPPSSPSSSGSSGFSRVGCTSVGISLGCCTTLGTFGLCSTGFRPAGRRGGGGGGGAAVQKVKRTAGGVRPSPGQTGPSNSPTAHGPVNT